MLEPALGLLRHVAEQPVVVALTASASTWGAGAGAAAARVFIARQFAAGCQRLGVPKRAAVICPP